MNKTDPVLDLLGQMLTNMSFALVPLTWLVDVFPPLRYLPDGLPGAGFKNTARKWRKINQAVADLPFLFARRQMATGTHRPSYVSRSTQELRKDSNPSSSLNQQIEADVKSTAAIMFLGGSDTTATTLRTFVWAMVMFPKVQRKAQEEIDTVIGVERLPNLGDRERLPYIEAVVKEALRMTPVTPMGFAHASSEEVVCNGYKIPKGSVILPAVWWILHDPEVYSKPMCFQPERYEKPRGEPGPEPVRFGFGRRKCPGRYVAESNLFLAIAQILTTFDITKAVGRHGVQMEAELKFGYGALGQMADFPYKIAPRSEKHAQLIRNIDLGDQEEGDSKYIQNDLMMRGLSKSTHDQELSQEGP